MIVVAFLLASVMGPTALDAERAFAADAQKLGQWTAFRKWTSDEATMFVPAATDAQAWLKDRKDPVTSVGWWPTQSYVSCDGTLAVNTGGWRRGDGSVGYFSTVWRRRGDGSWKWVMDHGDVLKAARAKPHKPRVIVASCKGRAVFDIGGYVGTDLIYLAKDRTVDAGWSVDSQGNRFFFADIWTGRNHKLVIDDRVAAQAAAQ